MDVPSSRPHRKLPAELNQQIYLCFNPATQRKFIYGLGWDFYAMFRQKLLTKIKRVCNPDWNGLNRTSTGAIVTRDVHYADSTAIIKYIFAEKGFAISGKHSRVDSFPGTIIYYYEVKLLSQSYFCRIGLSNGNPIGEYLGEYPDSYAIRTGYNFCRLAEKTHSFELPNEAFQALEPKDKGNAYVYGCGLVMDPNDKLAIFFTLNGFLMGRLFPISPWMDDYDDYLFPTITFDCKVPSIEANFGNDKDKPFAYDIKKCPGMGLDCI